jgi:hypothetical protein
MDANRRTRTAAALTLACALLLPPAVAVGADRRGLGRALAQKLAAKKALRPETHATDFTGVDLGCITLSTRELRAFGYRGHAFLCEAAASGEVLGAVLTRSGHARCHIRGVYTGDLCYEFDICGFPDTACIVE